MEILAQVDPKSALLMHVLFLPGSHRSPARFCVWQFVEPLRTVGHPVEVRVTRHDGHWPSNGSGGGLQRLGAYFASAWRAACGLAEQTHWRPRCQNNT